jgi:enamine deaminase RidA (YjgF/YER057c/UK114 family)
MSLEPINPPGWKSPIGYSNAMLATGGRILFLAGQVAFDAEQNVVGEGDLTAQFEQVMKNLQTVVETAGGALTDIARMTIFVQDKDDYIARGRKIGGIYRAFFGDHYPAMTLVEIARFYEPGILLEIEATAVIGE